MDRLNIKKINNLYLYLLKNGNKLYANYLFNIALDYICRDQIIKTSVRKNKLLHLLGQAGGRTVGIMSPYKTLFSRKENKDRYASFIRDLQKMRLDTLGNFWHGKWEEDVYLDKQHSVEVQDRINAIVNTIDSGGSDRAIVILTDLSSITEEQEVEIKGLSEDYKEEGGELISARIRQTKIPTWYAGSTEGPIFEDSDTGDRYITTPAAERSVIIKDVSFEQMKMLAEKYNQDAFIYRSSDGVTGMYWISGKNNGNVELATLPTEGSARTSLEVDVGDLYTKSKPRGNFPSFEYDFWQSEMVPYDGEVTMKNLQTILGR